MKSIVFSILVVLAATNSVLAEEVVVYKSPTCGCCKKWISHLEQNGFTVVSKDVENVAPYKLKYGVPLTATSCHTAVVGGYTIEGHVPASDIKRLLQEKPPIKGLTVPGMPIGSPGMEQGSRKQRYDVLSFDKNGKKKVFSSH